MNSLNGDVAGDVAVSCELGDLEPVMDPGRARHLSEVLKALAHPVRLQIVALLCHEREHVNGMAARLGQPQAVISQQLRILRMRGLVQVERRSGYAIYDLAEPRLKDLVRCMEGCA
jgi:ArsR family transcriptional regulator